MDQPKPQATAGAAHEEVSLVRGGPFYRVQELTRLLTAEQWNPGRRIVFALAVGWIPLLLITLLFNPQSVGGLLTDYPINIRMLIGVPVLLLGQAVMDRAFRTMVRHIREVGLLASAELTKMDRVTATLIRLRDSWIPEILIVVAVYAMCQPWLAHTSDLRAPGP